MDEIRLKAAAESYLLKTKISRLQGHVVLGFAVGWEEADRGRLGGGNAREIGSDQPHTTHVHRFSEGEELVSEGFCPKRIIHSFNCPFAANSLSYAPCFFSAVSQNFMPLPFGKRCDRRRSRTKLALSRTSRSCTPKHYKCRQKRDKKNIQQPVFAGRHRPNY